MFTLFYCKFSLLRLIPPLPFPDLFRTAFKQAAIQQLFKPTDYEEKNPSKLCKKDKWGIT